MLRRILFALLASLPALGQAPSDPVAPIVGPRGVLHGATFQILSAPPFTGPPQGVAPGAIFVLQGESLGPEELVAGQAPFGLRLPDVPGGTEVHVRSIGSNKVAQASIVYAVNHQVAAILPRDFPLGDAEVTVWFGGLASEPVPVPVVFSFPGLFTLSQDGHGRAVVQNVDEDGSLTLNSLVHSARPGQYVTLWGTGLGLATREDVRVYFGEDFYPAVYAGPAPGIPGVDQINVRIPDNLPDRGCYVRLVVAGDGLGSGPASIAIADQNGPCSHPWGLSGERMAEIEAGVPARLVSVSLWNHERPREYTSLSGAGGYAFVLSVGRLEATSRAPIFGPEHACAWRASVIYTDEAFPDLPDFPPPTPQPNTDVPSEQTPAGYPWMLTDPSGRLLTLDSRGSVQDLSSVGMESQDALFGNPGEWTARIPGGAHIGPLEFRFQVPAVPLVNAPTAIRRNQDFELSWSPEQASPDDTTVIRLEFQQPRAAEPGVFDQDSISCEVPTSTGALSIPMSLLDDPLDRTQDGKLTVSVSRSQLPTHSDAVDRVEAAATSTQSWSIPLE